MKASEFNESKYLNSDTAKDYQGKILTIYEVNADVIRDVRKMTIGFEGVEKLLVVNKTNRDILVEAYGDDTDAWQNQKVQLGIVKVMYDGKRTNSILLAPIDGADTKLAQEEQDYQDSMTPTPVKKGKK